MHTFKAHLLLLSHYNLIVKYKTVVKESVLQCVKTLMVFSMLLTPNASILKACSDIIAAAKYFGHKTTSKTIKFAGIKLIDYGRA